MINFPGSGRLAGVIPQNEGSSGPYNLVRILGIFDENYKKKGLLETLIKCLNQKYKQKDALSSFLRNIWENIKNKDCGLILLGTCRTMPPPP